jgi:hypothetical protein
MFNMDTHLNIALDTHPLGVIRIRWRWVGDCDSVVDVPDDYQPVLLSGLGFKRRRTKYGGRCDRKDTNNGGFKHID